MLTSVAEFYEDDVATRTTAALSLIEPVIMIFMLKLINKYDLMGKYTNPGWFNWLAYGTAVIVIGLSLVLVFNSFA